MKYLRRDAMELLQNNILDNAGCYLGKGFDAILSDGSLRNLKFEANLAPLSQLNPSNRSEDQVQNSLLVWEALSELSPNLASEGAIWAYLTHFEGFKFAQQRWLSKFSKTKLMFPKQKEEFLKTVKKHFFAQGRTGCRDDNAIGLLWWNAYIANDLFSGEIERGLKAILRSADIRQATIERPGTYIRQPLLRGVARLLEDEPWLTDKEAHFRDFAKVLNRRGGGLLFETMSESAVLAFLRENVELAKELSGSTTA